MRRCRCRQALRFIGTDPIAFELEVGRRLRNPVPFGVEMTGITAIAATPDVEVGRPFGSQDLHAGIAQDHRSLIPSFRAADPIEPKSTALCAPNRQRILLCGCTCRLIGEKLQGFVIGAGTHQSPSKQVTQQWHDVAVMGRFVVDCFCSIHQIRRCRCRHPAAR